MDRSSHADRAVLRWTIEDSSNLASRRVHRADGQRQDYILGRLLRWIDFPPHTLGCVFHRVDRVLNVGRASSLCKQVRGWIAMNIGFALPNIGLVGAAEGGAMARQE